MIARGFVERGATVYLISRSSAPLNQAATDIGVSGAAHAMTADLSRIEEIVRVAALLEQRLDHLDILVNNAGTVWNESFDKFPVQGWDKVANLNVRSPFFLAQHLLPLLRRAAQAAPPARIINIASADALHVPLTDTYSYTAAKAGLVMLTRMLAQRLGPLGITVNAIAPGAFSTKMTERRFAMNVHDFLAQIPLGRLGTPEDIVGAAVYLASRAGAYVSGTVLSVDGGLVGGR
jgi:NAD(P)-dependent dehydrogenase (short-subunit alcohol dehydrogenase family)